MDSIDPVATNTALNAAKGDRDERPYTVNVSTVDDTADANPSQADVVIEGIKGMLARGELVRGSRLPVEKDLAELLGVSRSPLREGVRALAALGVVETRQGAGTYITSLDPRSLLSPLSFLAELQQPGMWKSFSPFAVCSRRRASRSPRRR